MTKLDKEILTKFITTTEMWITPVDDENIVSFIGGYEAAARRRCDFTERLKESLATKHKVYSSRPKII